MKRIFDQFGNYKGYIADPGYGLEGLVALVGIPFAFGLLVVLAIPGFIIVQIARLLIWLVKLPFIFFLWIFDTMVNAIREKEVVRIVIFSAAFFSIILCLMAMCIGAYLWLLKVSPPETIQTQHGQQIVQVVSSADSVEVHGAATIAECAGAPTPRLKAGMIAKVNGANNNAPNILRSGPGKDNRRLASMPTGTSLKVLDGPICASSYWYWKVQTRYGIGWTAEGDSSGYWLELVTDNR